ncbi:MAG: S41 family peptidase [Salinimicrobium sp.]
MKLLKNAIFACLVFSFFISCYDDLDDVIRPTSSLDVKRFVWRAMNSTYLYKDKIPALGDDYFANQQELDDYLKGFSSPEDLFYNGLVAEEDRFSFLVDDYRELEKNLDGINVSNGMKYGLVRPDRNLPEIFGYVRYVLPNTSAEEQGVERGMIFNEVDGEQLTVDNYPRLLEPASYTIGLAQKNGEVLQATGETISLVKQEYTTNPVYIAKVLETEKDPVGYLVYNGFTGIFDEALNEAFVMFKSAGVTDLVVDLRYNPGGSTETAVDLGSMITGQFTGEIFYTEQWNDQIQAELETLAPESLIHSFNQKLSTGGSLTSLGLNKVYVLTTLSTASASELLINGLEPYIDVVQIGQRTTGKFQASTTLYDSYNFRRNSDVNLGHTYAVQPLIYKTLNAAGRTDYLDGLQPDIEIPEDYFNLGTLGDPEEPLLKAALNAILGQPQEFTPQAADLKLIGEEGMHDLMFQRMYTKEQPELLNLKN